jgi:toxin ParE1/3/4
MKVVFREQAERDIDFIADEIAQSNFDAAIRFLNSIESTCELLERFPNIGTRRKAGESALRNLRSYVVRGFRNYLIFFNVNPESVEVIRVLHAARDHSRLV